MPQTVRTLPGQIPVAGHATRLAWDPLGFLERQRGCDPVVGLRLVGRDCYLVTDAEAALRVLVVQQECFDKGGPFMDAARLLVGNGVITCNAADHRMQRPVMKPAFHRSRVAGYADVMRQCVLEATAPWTAGQVFDVSAATYRMAALVVSRTLVASPAGKQAADVMAAALPQLLRGLLPRMLIPAAWVHRLPTRANRRFDRARARLDAAITEVIAQYRAGSGDEQDLLSRIMAGDEESGHRPDDSEVRDQIMSVLAAGVETTASLLAWTFHILARSPDVERRLWAELDASLGGRPVTFDDLTALPYTKRLLTEVLRLYPPTWLLSRVAVKRTDVCGFAVPQGADVIISPYALQRNPDVFPDPAGFDPDRWLPERLTSRQRQSFLAFGAGRRRCMGEFFGMTQATLALATVAGDWQLRTTGPGPLRPLPRFLLTPAGQHLQLHPRVPGEQG
ncbi:cytochrome P450 [Streptomyces syringium]|uniref:cytochrome P450 n=1 Tax=Streptomyces syringium TaxID=76729 RepID=UPI0037D1546C